MRATQPLGSPFALGEGGRPLIGGAGEGGGGRESEWENERERGGVKKDGERGKGVGEGME